MDFELLLLSLSARLWRKARKLQVSASLADLPQFDLKNSARTKKPSAQMCNWDPGVLDCFEKGHSKLNNFKFSEGVIVAVRCRRRNKLQMDNAKGKLLYEERQQERAVLAG